MRAKSHTWWATSLRLPYVGDEPTQGLGGAAAWSLCAFTYCRFGSFPIASSGKIDRKALPPPFRSEARKVATTASNDLERELCVIWRDVLKTAKVEIDDDFFELGGTSLRLFFCLRE